MSQPGSVVEVLVESQGSQVVGDHASGATTLLVENPTPFDDAGGQILLNGVAYSYTAASEVDDATPTGSAVTDNGDGTLTLDGATDNGDGTLTVDGATDNGDGTLTLTDVPVDSLGPGETYGLLLLATPLTADVADMTPVDLWNGTQVLDDLVLKVSTGEEGDPAVPVTLNSGQRAFWEAYLGPVDPPVAVTLSDDLSTLEDAPGWTPNIDGTTIVGLPDPPAVALDPPAASPAITGVQGNATGLTVVTEPILASTLLDYYVDGVLVAADQRTTVLNLTATDDAGTPMETDVDYTITVLAHNAAGAAPAASAGVTAQLDPAVSATQITAILQAGFILTGAIAVGTSMNLDPNGITITHPDGRQTYMRADGSGNQFVGQAILDAATILGSLTILGQTNGLNGLLTMGTGVSDPTDKPGVTSGYASLRFAATGYRRRGLAIDGTNWVTTDYVAAAANVQWWAISDGSAQGAFSIKGWSGSAGNVDPLGGVTKLGSYYYVLGKDYTDGGYWRVTAHSSTGVLHSSWRITAALNGESCAIGNDGTNILVAKRTGGDNLYITAYSPNGDTVSTLSCGTNSGWAGATMTGIVKASVDSATVRYVVSTTTGVLVINTSTGARVSGEEWPMATTPVQGIAKDTTWHNFDGYSTVHHYTDLTGTWDFAFTWVDNDAGGTGTAETKASTIRTLAPAKRARWTISLPAAPPDDGTPDGANTASLYAAPTGNTLVRQSALAEGTLSQTFTSLLTTGTAPPSSNGFVARSGAIGRLASLAADGDGPLIDFRGDGFHRIAGTAYAEATDDDTVSGSSVAAGGGTASVNVTFPSGRFSVAPEVTWSISGFVAGAGAVVCRQVDTVTASGCRLVVANLGTAAATFTDLPVTWHAVQMTPTSAAG